MAVGATGSNGWHFPIFGLGTTHVLDNPTVSTQTPAFGADTRIIRVSVTGDHCHFAIGSNPTASGERQPVNFSGQRRILQGEGRVEARRDRRARAWRR
jgi:hypothetical protein